MADIDRVRAALLKTGFELQTENPQDDIQIKRLLSRMTASKRKITLDIKNAETTAENVTKLKAQEGVAENSRITAGMMITGVGYIEAAKREVDSLEEANVLFTEMMADLALTKPELTKDCDQKVVKSEAEWEDYNKRVSDLIFKTASMFQSTPSASITSSRESSPHRV